MKTFRLFVLLLLAVLLPIRGAVAATMLCAEVQGAHAVSAVAEHDAHDMDDMHGVDMDMDMDSTDDHGAMPMDHEMHAEHAMSHHAAGTDAAVDGSSSPHHPASCHFCASACCMASIVGSIPSIAQPGVTASLVFPTLTAPLPAFQSDGQERPPRTI